MSNSEFRITEQFDTLEELLEAYKDKIQRVELIWTWPSVKIVPSGDYIMMWYHGEHCAKEIDIGFGVIEKDEEYSFDGPIDQAIEFAKDYGCWDGLDVFDNVVVVDGVLEAEYEAYNPYENYHPDYLAPSGVYESITLYGYMHSTDGDHWGPWMEWEGPIVDGWYITAPSGERVFRINRIIEKSRGITSWDMPHCKRCTHYSDCSADPDKCPRSKDIYGLYIPGCPNFVEVKE